jgi:hypothetical protein
MPFGIQVVGHHGRDALLLAAAAALEAVMATDPVMRRPTPDLAQLRAAPAIATMEGFLGFG